MITYVNKETKGAVELKVSEKKKNKKTIRGLKRTATDTNISAVLEGIANLQTLEAGAKTRIDIDMIVDQ